MKDKFTKLIFVLFFVSNFTFAKDNNKSETTNQLSNLLIELETTIYWNSVASEWKYFRVKWLDACKLCAEGQCIAQRLIEFESYTLPENMSAAWQNRKETWIKECGVAKTNTEVVKLLLEFETNVNWTCVKETWKDRREFWIKECYSIK